MKIKAIKIDVNHMRVSSIEMEDTLEGIYEAVECCLFTDVELYSSFLTQPPHCLLVDDEGAIGNNRLFRMEDQFFFGNGVIVRLHSLTGKYTDCQLDLSAVQSAVSFYTAKSVNSHFSL